MEKISVIITVYNKEKYIKRCIESVISQTYKNLEIIVVDDGSTDNSREIIKQYEGIVKYFFLEHTGVAKARNYGINQTNGRYFCFLDADDFLEKNMFNELSKYINKNPDIIKYKMKVLDEKEEIKEFINGPVFDIKKGKKAFRILAQRDVLIDSPCLYLFKTLYIKENKYFFEEGTYHEDFGIIPIILMFADSVISTKIIGYNYVHIPNSIIRTEEYDKKKKKVFDLLIHYDRMIKYIEKEKNSKSKKEIKKFYLRAILFKIDDLKGKDYQIFIEETEKRKIFTLKNGLKEWIRYNQKKRRK